MVAHDVRSFNPAQVALQGVTLGMARAEIDYLFCTPRLDGEGAPANPNPNLNANANANPNPNQAPALYTLVLELLLDPAGDGSSGDGSGDGSSGGGGGRGAGSGSGSGSGNGGGGGGEAGTAAPATVDVEACRVGLRVVSISGEQLRVNGVPLEVRGVNRHEHSAERGKAVSWAEMVADARLLKRFNFNAVRTSHYPNAPAWYALCDANANPHPHPHPNPNPNPNPSPDPNPLTLTRRARSPPRR